MASREAMNMGDRSSNLVANLKSNLSGVRQEMSLINQESRNWNQTIGGIGNRIKGFFGGGGDGGNTSSSLVAPNPIFNSAPQIVPMSETGQSLVSAGPARSITAGGGFSGGPTNLTTYVAGGGGGTLYQPEAGVPAMGTSGGGGGGALPSGGGLGGDGSSSAATNQTSFLGPIGKIINTASAMYNLASNLIPSTANAIEAQLLQQRTSFFTGGGIGTAKVNALQTDIAQKAMLSGDNPQMDVMRSYVAAQSYGLMGGNYQSFLGGVANVSNLIPGLGMEGAVRVTGAMQQARSVNMLRGIGIQLRDPVTGDLAAPDKVIEQIWQKICRDYSQAYGAGKKPSLDQIQISLQPGNALDSMLNQYFGGDPLLKQMVANGLLYKAQGGAGITKAELAAKGATTEAMLSYSQTAAAGQGLLAKAEEPAATGFGRANTYLQNYYNNVAPALVSALSDLKANVDTFISAFGGSPMSALLSGAATGIVGALKSLFSFLAPGGGGTDVGSAFSAGPLAIAGQMASGGPVDKNKTYIVGEQGPELFVPSTDGTIIPNNKIKASTQGGNYNNTYNFTVNVPNANTPEVIAAIRNLIYELDTSKKVSES